MARHHIDIPFLLTFQTLLIFLLLHLTTCLPTNATDDLTVPVPLSSNDTLTSPVASCATLPSWPEWFQPSEKFDSRDVELAMNLFYNDYVRDHGDTIYEFLRSGVTPVRKIPTQRLPLKVAHGTCFIVIAMRSQFKEGELPAETPSPSAGSDVSSFAQIFRGLALIDYKCAQDGIPGWYPAGDLNSIAVFIWQAASPINQRIRFNSEVFEEGFNISSLLGINTGSLRNISTS